MEVHTKETEDVPLAPLLIDCISVADAQEVSVRLDASGVGFVIAWGEPAPHIH